MHAFSYAICLGATLLSRRMEEGRRAHPAAELALIYAVVVLDRGGLGPLRQRGIQSKCERRKSGRLCGGEKQDGLR